MSGVHREFLGWSEPALPLAADWLLGRYGNDLSAVTVVLPGRRAGRRLIELLVQRAPASWSPPEVSTLAEVSDMLVAYPLPRAGQYQRTLCWTMALQGRERKELETILSDPPDTGDLPAWWKLAGMIERLHIELAAEALTFSDVLGNHADGYAYLHQAPQLEIERWQVLTRIQEAYAAALEEAGVCDFHLERTAAIRRGNIELPSNTLVMLGVASANRLQRLMLARLAEQHSLTALIIAPDRLANSFDDAGFIDPGAWQDFDLGLQDHQWQVADSPEQQAESVVRKLHEWSGDVAHDEVTLGTLDAEHLPYIEKQLAERGVALRSPEGTDLNRTPPLRLLLAVAAWLESRSFENFAALMRHPDVEDLCSTQLADHGLVGKLDKYFSKHLPQAVTGQWLDQTKLALAHKFLAELLGELSTIPNAPAATWGVRFVEVLNTFYGHRELDRSRESDRKLAAALQQLAAAATDLESLGDTASGRLHLSPSQALRLFVMPLLAAQVPPGRTVPESIEAVGWLELPLDDAPAMIVTDFREGIVPSPIGSTVFLPESLRNRLGMLNHEERLARDLHATAVLINTRASHQDKMLLMCCRHRTDGEGLLPSRLLFHCEPDRLAPRALAAFADSPPASPLAADSTEREYVLPGPRESLPTHLDPFSASRLNVYLHSPYEYYLKYTCKARTVDDRARELDPLKFGELIHEVLESYGRCEDMRGVIDARGITRYLNDTLQSSALESFGSAMRSTLRLQLLQMCHRLAHFATHQAELMAAGWIIHAVEWEPPGEVVECEFGDTKFKLRGKIDRIDHHPASNCWRIYDYKSGDAARETKSVFKPRLGKWIDVQLPLYHYLAEQVVGGRPCAGENATVQVGYFNLPKSNKSNPISLAAWDATAIAAMETQVAAAVNGIRENDFFDPDQNVPRDPRLAVLAGSGLLVPAGSAVDDEDAEVEA